MIKLKTQRQIGLTTSILTRLINDPTTVLVVRSNIQFSNMINRLENYNNKLWHLSVEELVHLRGRIIVMNELLRCPRLVDKDLTYLIDEGIDAEQLLILLALFDKSDVTYEAYYSYYGDNL